MLEPKGQPRGAKKCGGMSTDGAGVSSKITGRATTVIAFYCENATLASVKKLLTMPKKNEKFVEDDAVSLVHVADRVAARLKRKGKGKDGEYSASRVWNLRKLGNVLHPHDLARLLQNRDPRMRCDISHWDCFNWSLLHRPPNTLESLHGCRENQLQGTRPRQQLCFHFRPTDLLSLMPRRAPGTTTGRSMSQNPTLSVLVRGTRRVHVRGELLVLMSSGTVATAIGSSDSHEERFQRVWRAMQERPVEAVPVADVTAQARITILKPACEVMWMQRSLLRTAAFRAANATLDSIILPDSAEEASFCHEELCFTSLKDPFRNVSTVGIGGSSFGGGHPSRVGLEIDVVAPTHCCCTVHHEAV